MSAVINDSQFSPDTENTIALMKNEPIVSRASYESLSRLLPHVSQRRIAKGGVLYRAGEAAGILYFVAEGSMLLQAGGDNTVGKTPSSGVIDTVEKGYIGEEAILGSEIYMADAIAGTDALLVAIPREHFNELLKANPTIKSEYFVSIMNRFSREKLHAEPVRPVQAEKGAEAREIIGWLCALVLPPVVFHLTAGQLDLSARLYLCIFTATVVMWVFRLVADFIPGIFALVATLVFDLVPQSVVLSGFASDGFFMALSILGLSAVITASGLSYRAMLVVLKGLPNTPFWNNFGIMATGLILSPVVPSINGRVALVTPLLIDMVEALKLKFGGKAATRLALSAFTGVGVMSATFLTSKSVNFVVYGLLPVHIQEEFSWFHWLVGGLVCGVVMLVLYMVTSPLFFRTDEKPALSKEIVLAQLDLLGPMRAREWASVFGILIFALGVMTVSLHKIQPPWMALILLFFLLAFNFLRGNEFRDKIDWAFLMYLAGLVGMVAAMNQLGLSKFLAQHLGWLGDLMRSNFPLFVLVLTGVLFAIRLVAPINAAVSISAAILMPLADLNGVNPWLVGFVILVMCEHWFFPYQCSYYVQFENLTKRKQIYEQGDFLLFNTVSTLFRLAGIYASIPFWKSMGLL
jgi:di/tricarboxylate transporter/CRP-like cAMP-binding protein